MPQPLATIRVDFETAANAITAQKALVNKNSVVRKVDKERRNIDLWPFEIYAESIVSKGAIVLKMGKTIFLVVLCMVQSWVTKWGVPGMDLEHLSCLQYEYKSLEQQEIE